MSRLLVASFCLITVGCGSIPVEPAGWPAGLPPRAYYESAWEASGENREIETFEEYLTWVGRFYKGTPVSLGWTGVSEKVLADLEPEEARILAPRLACLGQTVSAEWAKDNEYRRVSTEVLRLWVRVLVQAKGHGKALVATDWLLSDTVALIRGELEPAAISADRYHDATTAGP
jgi:hypothetical protein